MKRYLLLAFIALIAIGGAALFFSFRAAIADPEIVGHPVHWEAENSLILMRDRTLVRRHMDTGEEETVFDLRALGEESLDDLELVYACFSDSKWHIPYYRKKENGISLLGYLAYSQETGQVSVKPSSANLINSGPACGELYRRDGTADAAVKNVPNPEPDQDDIAGQAYQTLFKPSDAHHVLAGAGSDSLSIVYEIVGEKKHIVLQGLRTPGSESLYKKQWNARWRDGDRPLSIRDPSSGKYLLHKTPGPLSKRVWAVSLDQAKVEAIDLPEGPWAAEKSENIFACGVCGCSCYRHQMFYYAGDRVFIHIWGSEYSEEVQGIYQLVPNPNGATWSHKVQGELSTPLVLSPDGCRVAVVRERFEVQNICN